MTVKVGFRGTIVIPKEIREKSSITHGDILEVSLREKSIILVKDTK